MADFTLKEARESLEYAKRHLAAGRDTWSFMNAAARRQQEHIKAGIPTFLEAATQNIDDASPSYKNKKTRQAWERAMLHYAKALHAKSMNAITPDDIADVLKPLWRTKLETARKLRWRLEAVFAEAIPKGFRNTAPNGDMIHTRNPADWDNNLAAMAAFKKSATKRLSKVRHHPSLRYQGLPAFYSELEGRSSDAALALRIVILTACRTLGVLGAKWSEFDFGNVLWTIPPARVKSEQEHVVPLSQPALHLLRSIPRLNGHPLAFAGKDRSHHLSNMSMLMLLRRMGRTDITPHGFRSSFRTWAQECTEFPREVAEMASAHLVGNDVERSYAHSTLLEKRKQLMNHWAEFCVTPKDGNVLNLHKQKA